MRISIWITWNTSPSRKKRSIAAATREFDDGGAEAPPLHAILRTALQVRSGGASAPPTRSVEMGKRRGNHPAFCVYAARVAGDVCSRRRPRRLCATAEAERRPACFRLSRNDDEILETRSF